MPPYLHAGTSIEFSFDSIAYVFLSGSLQDLVQYQHAFVSLLSLAFIAIVVAIHSIDACMVPATMFSFLKNDFHVPSIPIEDIYI